MKVALARAKSPSARATQLAALLQKWHDAGGSRVDSDLDGKIDDPGAVIMDAAWKKITDAGLCDRLGTGLCAELQDRINRYDTPPGGQYSGWHQYMDKDLRRLLGQKVAGRYHLTYCGKGRLAICAKELWAALDAAGKSLTAKLGSDPAAWREKTTPITFAPLPLITMQYTNKPSGIHQVMEFG
jgi:hypothetical protein